MGQIVFSMQTTKNKSINGTLVLPLGEMACYGYMFLIGGPFEDHFKTADIFAINLKAEGTKRAFDAELPIKDYGVPDDLALLREILEDAILQAMTGRMIAVGCMGGKGRTGLFMALLAKAVGIPNPVEYVRKHYYPNAVETAQQYDFVESYDVSWAENYIRAVWESHHAPLVPVTDTAPVDWDTTKETTGFWVWIKSLFGTFY